MKKKVVSAVILFAFTLSSCKECLKPLNRTAPVLINPGPDSSVSPTDETIHEPNKDAALPRALTPSSSPRTEDIPAEAAAIEEAPPGPDSTVIPTEETIHEPEVFTHDSISVDTKRAYTRNSRVSGETRRARALAAATSKQVSVPVSAEHIASITTSASSKDATEKAYNPIFDFSVINRLPEVTDQDCIVKKAFIRACASLTCANDIIKNPTTIEQSDLDKAEIFGTDAADASHAVSNFDDNHKLTDLEKIVGTLALFTGYAETIIVDVAHTINNNLTCDFSAAAYNYIDMINFFKFQNAKNPATSLIAKLYINENMKQDDMYINAIMEFTKKLMEVEDNYNEFKTEGYKK